MLLVAPVAWKAPSEPAQGQVPSRCPQKPGALCSVAGGALGAGMPKVRTALTCYHLGGTLGLPAGPASTPDRVLTLSKADCSHLVSSHRVFFLTQQCSGLAWVVPGGRELMHRLWSWKPNRRQVLLSSLLTYNVLSTEEPARWRLDSLSPPSRHRSGGSIFSTGIKLLLVFKNEASLAIISLDPCHKGNRLQVGASCCRCVCCSWGQGC